MTESMATMVHLGEIIQVYKGQWHFLCLGLAKITVAFCRDIVEVVSHACRDENIYMKPILLSFLSGFNMSLTCVRSSLPMDLPATLR